MSQLNTPDNGSPSGATTAQVKGDINSGRTGDKVAGFDPGASPLGTDDEAGGAALDPQLIAETRARESAGRPQDGAANAATPQLQPDASGLRQSYAVPVIAGVLAAAALGIALVAVL